MNCEGVNMKLEIKSIKPELDLLYDTDSDSVIFPKSDSELYLSFDELLKIVEEMIEFQAERIPF